MTTKIVLEPGSQEAVDEGCLCRAPFPRPDDIDPPEVQVNKYCELHGRLGRDPDSLRDRMIDDKRDRE